jgi:hypothetical protein
VPSNGVTKARPASFDRASAFCRRRDLFPPTVSHKAQAAEAEQQHPGRWLGDTGCWIALEEPLRPLTYAGYIDGGFLDSRRRDRLNIRQSNKCQ